MFASSVRFASLPKGPSLARTFSCTTTARAAEVKSLGVIGAGQMVGGRGWHSHIIRLTSSGIRNCTRRCAKGAGSRHISRHLTGIVGQRPQVCWYAELQFMLLLIASL